ncbi:hypothetical protein BCR35DRAFT_333176 [Leucosporidium creatinivorum]|uniref:BTB domain-containing protein n=1 Tax=Leucosporidium creatinivorum TaxID=106004 RepID=A0A1Y2EVV0_9BASI|nr:hypothetical protein BCR35DRAFT_333176 [Leucosporidium creatinivorum]
MTALQEGLAEPLRPSPPTPPTASAHYTISLRGTVFTLSGAVLQSHLPNYFTRALLAPPSSQLVTPRSSAMELDRDPKLFEVVVNYLSGYEVFPLSQTAFLTDRATATRNLLLDARFYKLKGLEEMVEKEVQRLEKGAIRGQEALGDRAGSAEQGERFKGIFSAM